MTLYLGKQTHVQCFIGCVPRLHYIALSLQTAKNKFAKDQGHRSGMPLHVPGVQNPADDGNRGIYATELKVDHRWFKGPRFMRDHPLKRKINNDQPPESTDLKEVYPAKKLFFCRKVPNLPIKKGPNIYLHFLILKPKPIFSYNFNNSCCCGRSLAVARGSLALD